MTGFKLQLGIDKDSLTLIRAAQQFITLGRSFAGGIPNMIWLAIDPFENNLVEFDSDYWIYASTSRVGDNAVITLMSEVDPGPAVPGMIYPFTASAIFGPPVSAPGQLTSRTYGARNDMPHASYPALTFGLSQVATVNGTAQRRRPVSANLVLATQQIQITPSDKIFVWLQSGRSSETAIEQVSGRYTIVDFGAGITDIQLTYNPQSGVFVPAAPDGLQASAATLTLPDGGTIERFEAVEVVRHGVF